MLKFDVEQAIIKAKDELKYSGFGKDSLYDAIEAAFRKVAKDLEKAKTVEEAKAILSPKKLFDTNRYPNEDVTSTILTFNHSEKTGLFYLNGLNMTLMPGNRVTPIIQDFKVGFDNHITHKKAYNLLKQGSVGLMVTRKTGERELAWVFLDFNKRKPDDSGFELVKRYKEYGMDIEEILKKFPIVYKTPYEKNDLIAKLIDGDRVDVTMLVNGQERQFQIEANARFNSIDVYEKGKKLDASHEISGYYKGEGPKQITEKTAPIEAEKEVHAQTDKSASRSVQNKDTEKPQQETKRASRKRKQNKLS